MVEKLFSLKTDIIFEPITFQSHNGFEFSIPDAFDQTLLVAVSFQKYPFIGPENLT